MSVSAQQSAFAVGVLSDLNAFHRSTVHSLQGMGITAVECVNDFFIITVCVTRVSSAY